MGYTFSSRVEQNRLRLNPSLPQNDLEEKESTRGQEHSLGQCQNQDTSAQTAMPSSHRVISHTRHHGGSFILNTPRKGALTISNLCERDKKKAKNTTDGTGS